MGAAAVANTEAATAAWAAPANAAGIDPSWSLLSVVPGARHLRYAARQCCRLKIRLSLLLRCGAVYAQCDFESGDATRG